MYIRSFDYSFIHFFGLFISSSFHSKGYGCQEVH